MELFVIGMHRSGTSALMHILNKMGFYIGSEDELFPPRSDNEKGFWERRDVVAVNDAILNELNCDWNDIFKFDIESLNTIRKDRQEELVDRIREILSVLGENTPWAVKDPRLCLVYPIWRKVLSDPICIYIYRDPVSVASSLRTRDAISLPLGIAMWVKYNMAAWRSIAQARKIVVAYEDLMADPKKTSRYLYDELVKNGVKNLHAPDPDETLKIIDPSLFHHKTDLKEHRYNLTLHQKEMYDALKRNDDKAISANLYVSDYEAGVLADAAAVADKNIFGANKGTYTYFERVRNKNVYEINNYIDFFQNANSGQLKKVIFKIFHRLASAVYRLHHKTGLRMEKLIELIFLYRSGLFDPRYYAMTYQDVKNEGKNPLLHFVTVGVREGRNPNIVFDVNFYCNAYPEIRQSILNPLIHFVIYGIKEARKVNANLMNDDKEPEKELSSALFAKEMRDNLKSRSPYYEDEIVQPVFSLTGTNPSASENRVALKTIAFYLPQFHPIPENDAWWGKGFTEWTNVTRSLPLYEGHYQPKLPADLGFYDLRVAEVQEKQVRMAKRHGIYGFCFHFYWFSGKRLLEKPLDLFIENPNIEFPFCLCWANENWTRRWDGEERKVLMKQSYKDGDNRNLIECLSRYLKHPNYIKVDGKPMVIIYRPDVIPDSKELIQCWKEYARLNGIGDLHVVAAQTFGTENPETYGFDAAVEFPPHNLEYTRPLNNYVKYFDPNFSGRISDLEEIVDSIVRSGTKRKRYLQYRTVFPAWDNTARKGKDASVYEPTDPILYAKWLDHIVDDTIRNHSPEHQFIFINAWNEWAEGAYLEPDRRFGYAFLNATSRVLSKHLGCESDIDNHKYYFIHIPKTAGMSLYASIQNVVGKDQTFFFHTRSMRKNRHQLFEENHRRCRVMGGHLQLDIVADMVKGNALSWKFFTVFREPKERLISLYNYVTTSGLDDHQAFSGMDWETFLDHFEKKNMSMCKMFHPSGRFKDADREIQTYKISVYTLNEYSELLIDLSKEFGQNLTQYQRNINIKKNPHLPEIPHVDEVLQEDHKLYAAALSGKYKYRLKHSTSLG
jgi:hypothetical protein